MAKPIIVIQVNKDCPVKQLKEIADRIIANTDNEYHVLVCAISTEPNITISTHNDCKGLTDIDIEKLIKEFYNDQQRTLPV